MRQEDIRIQIIAQSVFNSRVRAVRQEMAILSTKILICIYLILKILEYLGQKYQVVLKGLNQQL